MSPSGFNSHATKEGIMPTFLHRTALLAALAAAQLGLSRTASSDGITQPTREAAIRNIEVLNAFLKVKDEVKVPAKERGVIASFHKEPGVLVTTGDLLGALDSGEARLNLDIARIDLEAAVHEYEQSVDEKIGAMSLEEAQEALAKAKLSQQIAKTKADSEIAIELAKTSLAVAKEELQRGEKAREAFRSSISDLDLLRFRMARDEKDLQLKQARHEQQLAILDHESYTVAVNEHGAAVRRLELEQTDIANDRVLAALTVKRLRKLVELADEKLRRHELVAPLPGLIIEQLRKPGEWVESGEDVVRIIRLDKLLAEGYVRAADVDQSLVGAPTQVTVSNGDNVIRVTGRVVFVSPEVDPVNLEVAVRVEIENADLKLRPGQPAKITITPQELTQQ